MNSRRPMSPSRDRWADEPVEPPPHPSELNLATRAPFWLSKLAPLTTARASLGKLVPLAAVRPWLSKLAPLTTTRPSIASVWSSLAELTPVAFARYLIAFFVGVVAAVAWQSYRSGTNEGTAETAAALYSVRQSVDNLAAEITKVRAVEQDILGKISAPPPPPVASPARNPGQRPSSVR
jgi:hypothetical protein